MGEWAPGRRRRARLSAAVAEKPDPPHRASQRLSAVSADRIEIGVLLPAWSVWECSWSAMSSNAAYAARCTRALSIRSSSGRRLQDLLRPWDILPHSMVMRVRPAPDARHQCSGMSASCAAR
jgi:hypothetical protein